MLPDEQARFSQANASPGIVDLKGDSGAGALLPVAHPASAWAER